MNYDALPAYEVNVDASRVQGPLETWRLCMGIGGINAQPPDEALGERAVRAVQELRLPMVRIFLQEYLAVVMSDGSYDWRRIDAYVHGAARLGDVMAAFCLKPDALFHRKDQTLIMPEAPEDAAAFEALAQAVAERYAGIITHWEIGNETDIGEDGGCPLIITDDAAYCAYYKRMVAAIKRGNPQAKVGGTAVAYSSDSPQLPSLIAWCREGNAPLDFISWHFYSSNSEAHAALVRKYAALLTDWPGTRPLMTVTEWAASFPSETGAVVETADDAQRTASYFATACRYLDEGLDYSFFYHLYDCACYHDEFAPFFQDVEIMNKHWNKVPHRFGMFGQDRRARPHYQLWWLMRGMGDTRLAVQTAQPGFTVLAGADRHGGIAVMVGSQCAEGGVIADVHFIGLDCGVYSVLVERVFGRENLSRDGLTLDAIDEREISSDGVWRCPVYLPPDAVVRIALKKRR